MARNDRLVPPNYFSDLIGSNVHIYAAQVSDLRKLDPPRRPVLTLFIDTIPNKTDDIRRALPTPRQHWTSVKCGPVIEFACVDGDGEDLLGTVPSPASYFNEAFSEFAPLVDVSIIVKAIGEHATADHVLEGHWGMQLRRARNLMKRHDLAWKLMMSDWEGTHGRIGWVPVEETHTCAASFMETPYTCVGHATEHTTLSGIDYWFCRSHFSAFNASSYTKRTTSTK